MSDCQFSPDTSFFVSSCEMDRCVFKWVIKYNEKKLTKIAIRDKQAK